MLIKNRKYIITKDLLKKYYNSSLSNAKELISESNILHSNRCYARSYFLSCSSIEECGKALLAFNGLGRNLNDPAIQSTLKRNFEDHSSKNLIGLVSITNFTKISKEYLDFILKTSSSLQRGREKSLYTDILDDGQITIPHEIVSEENSNDTLKLAKYIFEITENYIKTNKPRIYSSFEDKFFSLPLHKTIKMFNENDFWEYVLDQLKINLKFDFMKYAVQYWELYFNKNKKFKGI